MYDMIVVLLWHVHALVSIKATECYEVYMYLLNLTLMARYMTPRATDCDRVYGCTR